MPLYELVCIAGHYRQFSTIRDLVKSTALHVIEHGGNVRSIESWGTHNLPEKMRRHKINHYEGDYWTMKFDCSPVTLKALDAQYQIDPRVIRWTNIKLGDSIYHLAGDRSQTIGWGSSPVPSTFNQKFGPQDVLLKEELLLSVEAGLARTAAFEKRAASKQIGGETSASASGSMPPSVGLNAKLQERREAVKAAGEDLWSDISVKAKVVEEGGETKAASP